MVSTKTYTGIFALLFVLATAQVGVEYAGLLEEGTYWIAFGAIMVLSAVKALYVVAYFQHLKFEPRAVAYVMGIALTAFIALTVAASYSIL